MVARNDLDFPALSPFKPPGEPRGYGVTGAGFDSLLHSGLSTPLGFSLRFLVLTRQGEDRHNHLFRVHLPLSEDSTVRNGVNLDPGPDDRTKKIKAFFQLFPT